MNYRKVLTGKLLEALLSLLPRQPKPAPIVIRTRFNQPTTTKRPF
jgi:hypothetical protein